MHVTNLQQISIALYVYEPEHLSATYMKVDDYILPILDGVLKCM